MALSLDSFINNYKIVEKNSWHKEPDIYNLNLSNIIPDRRVYKNIFDTPAQKTYYGVIADILNNSVTIAFENTNNNTKEYRFFNKNKFNFQLSINDLVTLNEKQDSDGTTKFYFEKFTPTQNDLNRERELLTYLENNMDIEDEF